MGRYLYHGSMFDTVDNPLCPGIVHTGKELKWDGGDESNHYLYACANAYEAILLGMGNWAANELNSNGFKYDLDSKTCIFYFKEGELITERALEEAMQRATVYLYTILMKPHHNWMENKNPHNNINHEYKTRNAIPRKDFLIIRIEALKWLKDKDWKWLTTTR